MNNTLFLLENKQKNPKALNPTIKQGLCIQEKLVEENKNNLQITTMYCFQNTRINKQNFHMFNTLPFLAGCR